MSGVVNMQYYSHVCLTALDAALEFLQQFVVPSTWKTEVKEESSSSEDEEEEEEGEQEEDASGEEEEVEAEALTCSYAHIYLPGKTRISNCLVSCLQEEVEPFPEERENFLQQLYKFMEDRGEPRVQIQLMLLQNNLFILKVQDSALELSTCC